MAISKASNSTILSGFKKYLSLNSESKLEVSILACGAGGGTPGNNANGSRGGNGGSVFGKMQPVLSTTYNLIIGGGGAGVNSNTSNPTRPNGGGGLAGNVGYGGQGGGYTGIFLGSVLQSNSVIIAGGGGSAAWDGPVLNGGAGGVTGGSGYGSGATQSAVGSKGGSGSQTAAALLGGDANGGDEGGGGGGGGGYFGGGAGSGAEGGSGGGGSSYWNSSLVYDVVAVTGAGATGGYAGITGNVNGNGGTLRISYPSSYPNLTIGGGLTYTGPTTVAGNKVYFFTAGSGGILW